MNFLALGLDYDGTLAHDGQVAASTITALERLRESNRKLLLVTGRQLEDLLNAFPRPDLFEWIVAENGALLYCPKTRETCLLAESVPPEFPEILRQRGVDNLAVGRSVVATWLPHECTVLGVLRELGLDRQIIFNKNAVMVLPTGVNKANGLAAALAEMKISHHNVVAVGDAENDLPMLRHCRCGVAVNNALDSVKATADLVMKGDHGAGVEELVEALLADDLAGELSKVKPRGILLGVVKGKPEDKVFLPSLGESVLVAGPSGSGKSSSITGFLERMAKAAYQFCILDPEGDYEGFEQAISLGNPHYVPSADEVLSLLGRMQNAVVNLLGVTVDARPAVASELLRKCQDLRASKGRPHWFVIDEAHHIFPSDVPAENTFVAEPPKTSLMITVHPNHVRKETLASTDVVIAVGINPDQTIREFCQTLGIEEPDLQPVSLEHGEVLAWFRHQSGAPLTVVTEPGKTEHKRHIRKYAEGDLGVGSFVFHGPDGRLSLVAHNLNTFIRMGEGVDDRTWEYHLRAGHISEWLRLIVKDNELADQVRDLERRDSPPQQSRKEVIEAICARYTLPE
jgi:hypothetical protein